MFLNLLIVLSVIAIVGLIIRLLKNDVPIVKAPLTYDNHQPGDEYQVCTTFARDAKAALLHPYENKDVVNLYSTLR